MNADFLWLSGWSFGREIWSPLIEAFPEGKHHTVDFLSCEREGDIFQYAVHALKACKRPVVLVGWSMGAMVALKLASLYPERVERLLLIAGTDRFVRRDKGESGWDGRMLTRMAAQLQRNPSRVLADFDQRLFSSVERERGLHEVWRQRFRSSLPSVSSLVAGLEFLQNFHVNLEAAPLLVRTFLLTGGEDAICFPEAARRIARCLPQSDLQIWAETGHAPFFAKPGRFLAWMRKGAEING